MRIDCCLRDMQILQSFCNFLFKSWPCKQCHTVGFILKSKMAAKASTQNQGFINGIIFSSIFLCQGAEQQDNVDHSERKSIFRKSISIHYFQQQFFRKSDIFNTSHFKSNILLLKVKLFIYYFKIPLLLLSVTVKMESWVVLNAPPLTGREDWVQI